MLALLSIYQERGQRSCRLEFQSPRLQASADLRVSITKVSESPSVCSVAFLPLWWNTQDQPLEGRKVYILTQGYRDFSPQLAGSMALGPR